jgi:bifunctional oligoribonuclease and PAP phosphatase NrnA
MKNNFAKVREIIEKHDNILITTHLLPDGDAIGSVLALSEYLRNKGKKTFVVNYSPTPDYLEFLDLNKEIRVFKFDKESNIPLIEKAEVIFLVDTNEFSRTRFMEPYLKNSKAIKICIDHHADLKEKDFNISISSVDYPATSQILYDFFFDDNPDCINKFIAENLYAGIMTDTGSFRYPRTDERTFLISADLVRRGADPVYIFDIIYSNSPKTKILLLARFINSFKFFYDDNLLIGYVTQKDFNEFGLHVQDVEGFSSFIMTIQKVKIGIVLVELPDCVKVSLRSKGNIPINELARKIGGGGHKNAAGATVVNMNLKEIENFIIKNTTDFLS